MNVIPMPVSVDDREGAPFVLSAATPIVATQNFDAMVAWFRSALESSAGMSLTSSPAGSAPAIHIDIVQSHPGLERLPAAGGRRADDGDPGAERYALDIAGDAIRLQAFAPEGIFRGLTTLVQLAATSPVTGEGVEIAPATILDAPRLAWRGLSFDVVRRAYPVDEVKAVIDLLTLYKANVLHLHLTDTEGWRIEIDSWPKLAEVGGSTARGDRPGGYYTKDQYRDLVKYAAERFITIVPEIEMPGHVTALLNAYPELAGNGVDPETTTLDRQSAFHVLHPDNPRIFLFLQDVLGELAEMTPGGYIHIGGDEALGMDADLYRRFLQRAREIVYATGKKVVAWQETSRSGFAPEDVAQIWLEPSVHDLDEDDKAEAEPQPEPSPEQRELHEAFAHAAEISPQDLPRILEQGPAILMALGPYAYLDTKYREPSADLSQAHDQARIGAPFYRSRTVRDFYEWDPATVKAGNGVSEDLIAGVEGAVWCEHIESSRELFFQLLPRIPGILEKGWSPAADESSMWDAYRTRLAAQDAIWERHGWTYFRSSLVWDTPR